MEPMVDSQWDDLKEMLIGNTFAGPDPRHNFAPWLFDAYTLSEVIVVSAAMRVVMNDYRRIVRASLFQNLDRQAPAALKELISFALRKAKEACEEPRAYMFVDTMDWVKQKINPPILDTDDPLVYLSLVLQHIVTMATKPASPVEKIFMMIQYAIADKGGDPDDITKFVRIVEILHGVTVPPQMLAHATSNTNTTFPRGRSPEDSANADMMVLGHNMEIFRELAVETDDIDIESKVKNIKAYIKVVMSRFNLPVLDDAVKHKKEVKKKYLRRVENALRDRVFELTHPNVPLPTDPAELARARGQQICFHLPRDDPHTVAAPPVVAPPPVVGFNVREFSESFLRSATVAAPPVVGFTPVAGFTPFAGPGHRLSVEKKELTEADFELLFPPLDDDELCVIYDYSDDDYYYEPYASMVSLDGMD